MMAKYDGWTIKILWHKIPWLIPTFLSPTRTDARKKFEIEWRENYQKRRRKGDLKLVKVKLVEVE